MYVPTADLLVQGRQKLLDGGAAVETDHLVRAVQEVHRDGMGERVVVRVLQQDRQDFHPRWLDLPAAVLQRPFQSTLAVSRVLSAFRSEKF